MGVDRLEAARNAHNTRGNIDFGWVLTGSKQPAISCKRPQHKTQHRVRMGAIYCAHNGQTNCITGGSSAQDKLCTPWADNCVTRASSVQDKWCTQWADMRNPLKKKRSGSEQKSDLATTRCGSNGRSQITGAHSSQSLKPRSRSPSQFLTKSLFALLQIALRSANTSLIRHRNSLQNRF